MLQGTGADRPGRAALRRCRRRPGGYPVNPNGSQGDVAGLCDATGRVLGLMPHPERHVLPTQHPRWTREGLAAEGDGLALFRNAVRVLRLTRTMSCPSHQRRRTPVSDLASLALEEDLPDQRPATLTSQAVIRRRAIGHGRPRRLGNRASSPACRPLHGRSPSIDPTLIVRAAARGRLASCSRAIAWPSSAAGYRSILTGRAHGPELPAAAQRHRHADRAATSMRSPACRAKVLDTRKTTPGWRLLEKYAVRCGGGHNHRMGLYDGILIKDNHLAALGMATPIAIAEAVRLARDKHGTTLPLEIEVDTLEQLDAALPAQPDIVLLDNMPPAELREAVRRRNAVAPGVLLEASGGVTLATVRAIAETGVDRISVGALTHSAPALDIALDYMP